jgi:signal transduction histidine kinase
MSRNDEIREPGGGAANESPRKRFGLPVKTTIAVMTLLIAAVAICGVVLLKITKSMLVQSRETQVVQFAYGVAASAGSANMTDGRGLREILSRLDQTPNLDFVSITDPQMITLATYTGNAASHGAYDKASRTPGWNAAGHVAQVRRINVGADKASQVVTVPIFTINEKGKSSLVGYLHAGFADDIDAQLRMLQGLILLTCMGVVVLAIPIAALVARHITVPIQTVANAAHQLAKGELGHRVSMLRSDELGELADAFNKMAYTVQQQQDEILSANTDLEKKVHDRTAEIEKVNARLTAEMAEKEDFLRAVSHDLNAPLRNISGMTSMLMIKYKDTLEKDAIQRLERIQKNVEIECELISELLELSRLKSRREKIETLDLHELVIGVSEQFSSDFETRKITFKVDGHLPVMQGERARLRQAFQNLIDNAIKYMREDGPREIVVTSKWEEHELVMSVADTGMGIAAEDVPQLFHVFRRAKNAQAMKIPGKGVGLASVKSIIENYGGRLWVESTLGVGTTFHISIPRQCFEHAATNSHSVQAKEAAI